MGEADVFSSCKGLKLPGNPAMEYGRLVTGAGTNVGGTATRDKAVNRTKCLQWQICINKSYVVSLNELTSVLKKKECG